jgi:DNA repair ATPase RecN
VVVLIKQEKNMELTKERFTELYYSKRDAEIAKMLGVKTVKTVRTYARSLGLKTKGTGYVYADDKRKKTIVEFL